LTNITNVQLRGLSAKILVNGREVVTITVSPFDSVLIQEIIFHQEKVS
jgi:hypothetical protein